MDYEKAYNEAIKRAKAIIEVAEKEEEVYKSAITIFPELCESEDERIRKEIEQLIQCMHDADPRKERWIAWLEKQGEHKRFRDFIQIGDKVTRNEAGELVNLSQLARIAKPRRAKPVDNVESKFKVGDWVVNPYGDVWHIDSLDGKSYQVSNKGKYNYFPIAKQDEMHLWTFADAKDGDVLVNGSNIFIFHFINDTRLMGYCHVNTNDGKFYDDLGKNECFCLIDAVVNPATKFQRNILFTRMKEAGYEWDTEKKELKKIEDEEYDGEDYGIDSLYHAQRILEKTLGSVDGYQTDDGILDHKAAITAVKKLYEQKPAWSEEDETNSYHLKTLLENLSKDKKYEFRVISEYDRDKYTAWLKSLKQRIGWKPSNEQIEALEHFVRSIGESGYASPYDNNTKLLYSLLEQLKKLKA